MSVPINFMNVARLFGTRTDLRELKSIVDTYAKHRLVEGIVVRINTANRGKRLVVCQRFELGVQDDEPCLVVDHQVSLAALPMSWGGC